MPPVRFLLSLPFSLPFTPQIYLHPKIAEPLLNGPCVRKRVEGVFFLKKLFEELLQRLQGQSLGF
jgi:hypothetical protein